MFSTKKLASSTNLFTQFLLFVVFLLGINHSIFSQTESVYLTWDNTSTTLSKCFEQKKFKVLVQNKTGAPISNATIWPTFPAGVSIVPGTFVDKTDVNSVNLNLLGSPYVGGGVTWDGTKFTIPNAIPDLAVVEIEFELFANCSAANSASVFNTYVLKSNGVEQLTKVNNVTGVETKAVQTANYALLSPVLSIASVTNSSLSNLNVGDTYVQDVAIVNGGLGEVKKMTATIDHNAVSSNTFTNLSVIDEFDNIAGTATLQSNGKVVDIVLTNSLLQNKTVRLRYTVTVINCNMTSRNITVTYGCPGGVVCTTSNMVTSLNAISTVAPTVKITTTETPFTSSCGLISSTGAVTRQIKTVYENTGTSPVTLYNVKFGFMWYAGSDIFNISGYTENIVESSIMVTEDNGIPYAPSNIAVYGRNTYSQNVGHCSYNKATSYIMTWTTGYVLAPGAELTIDYGLTQCDNSAVVDGKADGVTLDQGQYYYGTSYYAAGNIGATANYKNQCGVSTNFIHNAGGMYGYHMLSTYIKSTDTPPQVVGASTFPLEFNMDLKADTFNPYGSVFNISTLATKRTYQAEIEVPAGVTYVPNSIAVTGGAVRSGYPIFSGNKLIVKLANYGDRGISPLIRATFLSDGVTPCGKLPITYRAIAVWDSSCTNPLISRTIRKDSIEFVCPIACPSIGPISSDNKRITLGLPDNNNDGYPDASGSLDMNKIYLNYIRMNDVYRSTTKYKLYTTANYVQADHRFTLDAALLLKNPNVNLTPEGSPTITLTRAGTDTPITGTIVRMSAAKNDFIIKWDNALPSTWGSYQINDEVTVTQDYKLNTEIFYNTTNVEVQFIPATFNSTVYIASAPTIADNNWTYDGPLKTSCLSLKSGVRYVTSLRVSPSTFYQNTSTICNFVEFATVLNLSGATFSYPFEYRNAGELDEIKYTLSSGFTYNSSYSVQTMVSGYVAGSIDAFRTISGNVVTYDLKAYRNSLANTTIQRKYPSENQTTWLTIKAIPSSRCDTQTNLTIASEMKYRRTFNYSPLNEITLTDNKSLPFNFTYNALNATAITPAVQTPNSGTGSYGFKLTNPSLTQTISNGWFYLKTQAGNITISNVKIGGAAAIPNANGFYLLTTLAANSFVDVTFDMTLVGNCNADFIKVYYGNECSTTLVPTSFSTIACSKQIDFTINPAVASMDAQVKALNGGQPFAFCSPFTVEFDVSSASLGNIFDIKTQVNLPTGIEFVPNSVKVKYPSSGAFTAVSYNPTVSSTGNQLDFNITTPSIGGGSGVISQTFLPGTANVSQNIVTVQYQVKTVCGADEGVSIKHTFSSNKSCGNSLPQIVKQSEPIIFSDVVNFAYSMDFTRTKSAVIKNCTTGSPFHISMKNVGPSSTPSDNEISLVIPSTMQFAAYTSAGNIRNGSLVQPDDQDNGDGTHTLSWPITANVAQGDSIVMDVMLKPVEGLSTYPTLGVFLFVGKNIPLSCNGVDCDVFKMNGFKVFMVSTEGGPAVPEVTIAQPNCTTATGSYTIDSPTGTGYTYSMDSGTYSNTMSVSNLNPGNYTVNVQNANQCFNQTTITIQPQPDLAVVPNLTTVQPTCTTNTGKITVNTPLASAGYVFSIDGGAYSSSNQFTVAANTAPHTISAKRTTSVCAQTANSASIISQPVTLPAPGTISGINSVLPGTNQSYSITAVPNAVSYVWTLPVSWTPSSTLDGTSASATIGSNGGIVKVASVSLDGCISPTSNLTVTTGCRAGEAAPTFASTVKNINCGATFDLSTLVGTNLPSNCSNCVLTFHTDSIAVGSNKLSGTALTSAPIGIYRAAWYDPSNDCYSNLTAKIEVKNVYPAKPEIIKTNPTCTTSTGTIEITNPVGAAYSYSIDNTNYQTSATFSGLNPGNYNIRIKNNYGCTTDSLGINIAVQPISTVPTGKSLQIYTGTKTIAALQVVGTGIQWYPSAVGGTALASTTSLTDEATYYATQFTNGCESDRFAVKVNRISDDSQNLCVDTKIADLVTTPLNNDVARWYSSSNSKTPLSSTAVLVTGTYFVEEYIDGSAQVSTFAGSPLGTAGVADGSASVATFNSPFGLASDSDGNIYVSEINSHTIRKITPAGSVTTLAGSGSNGFNDGTGTSATFNYPLGLAVNTSGDVFVADLMNNRIRKITQSGIVSTFAGDGTTSIVHNPAVLAFGPDGYLYVGNKGDHTIKKISPTGTVSLFAGSGVAGNADGLGALASFNAPEGLAFDSAGNLFVSDNSNFVIRKITPTGLVSTFAGSGSFGFVNGNGTAASFDYLTGLSIDSKDNLYVFENNNKVLRKITPNADVSTYAGNGSSFYADGDLLTSGFKQTTHTVVDKFDNIYLAESAGNRVRKISAEIVSNRVPVNVIIDEIPKATVSVEQPVCGTPTGKITINSPLGTQYSYSIDGGSYQSSTEFNALTASSTYTIRVKSSTLGCESDTTQVTVSKALIVPAKPLISYARPLTFCLGDSTVLVSNTAAGNQWFKNGVAISGATNDTLIVHAAGNYKTKITSLDACTSLFSDSLDITVNAVQTVSITANSLPNKLVTVCRVNSDGTFGEAEFLAEVKIGATVQDNNDFDFEWRKNSVAIGSSNSANWVSGVLGTYRVVATNKATGCIAISDTIRLTNFASPIFSLTSQQVTEFNYVCAGKPVVIKAISSEASLQYRWKDYFYGGSPSSPFLSNVGVIGSADSLVHNQSYLHNTTLNVGDAPFVTTANAGVYGFAQYYLEVKDVHGCIDNSHVFRFYEALPVSAPIISGDTLGTYCSDKTIVLVSSKSSGNQWYKDGNLISGATNSSLTVTSSGSYQVKYTNDLGCESDLSLARNVNIVSLPNKPTITGNTNASYCEGSSVVISSSSNTGNQWYQNGVLIVGAVNKDFSVTASGIYSLKVTNSNGCVSAKSDSIEITIKPLPIAIIEQGLELAFSNCTNTPITLNSKDQLISGTSTYEWYYKSSFAGAETVLSTTTQSHNATTAGYYRVKVTTDACSEISTLTRIYDPPILNTTSTAVCSGDSVTISAVNSGIPNPVYKWFKNNVEIVGQSSAVFKAFQSGTYFVQVSSTSSSISANSCPVLITVNPLPTISITGNPSNMKVCSGGAVILSAVASGATSYSYRWIKDGALLSDTLINYSANVNGDYQVQVNDNNGCVNTSTIASVEILALPNPPSIAVLSQTTCTQSTGSIKVNSPTGTGYSYSMDGGSFQTSTVFTGVNVGEHSVRVKNPDGCISLASSKVEIFSNAGAPSLPVAGVSEQPTCIVSTGKILVSAPIGTGYTYSIDSTNYQSNLTFNAVAAGTYKVRVKNSDGCISESATALNVIANAGMPSTPSGSVTTQPSCSLATGTIVVDAPLGAAYTYSVNGIDYQSSTTFSNVAVGNYHIRVKNADGCVAEDATELHVLANAGIPLAPTASVTLQPTCSLSTGTIVVSAPTGTGFTYSIDSTNYQSGLTFSGVSAGNHKVWVKNADGCVNVSTSSLSVLANAGQPSVPAASVTVAPSCSLATGTIQVSAPLGTNYTYSVDSTHYQSSTIFSGLVAGTYKVRVKNSDGCITVNPTGLIIQSLAAVPAIPSAGARTIVNNCNNGGSVDLTTLQPASSSGISYEWWTGTSSTKAVQILNPNTYSSSSQAYLWAKNANGCYSTKADSVQVSIVTCCVDSPGMIIPKNMWMIGQKYEPADINDVKHISYDSTDLVKYVLVNMTDGKIKAINNSLPEFTGILSGDYRIYAINHRPEAIVTGISVGGKLTDIAPYCANWAYYNVLIGVGCDYSETWIHNAVSPAASGQTQKFVLVDAFDNNKIVAISNTTSFAKVNLSTFQIVELLYSGTINNLAVGNLLTDLSASNLNLTTSKQFKYCDAASIAFDGYLFNDLNKNAIENFSNENQIYLNSHTMFMKVLNNVTNEVITAASVYLGSFSIGLNLPDGSYRLIIDDNGDLADTIPHYPANWSGAPKPFNVTLGTISTPNFFNINSDYLVPYGLYSTLTAPTPGPSGTSIRYCLNASATPLEATGVTAATLNWYTVPTGGIATNDAPIPLTNAASTTHYYVSQSIDDVESERLDITVTVEGNLATPTSLSGPVTVSAGSTNVYKVSPVAGAVSYIWQLPSTFVGTSTVDSIVVVAGTSGGILKVAAVSSLGCQSGFKLLTIQASSDFDGDGVSNEQEALDGTDPNDGCKYEPSHVTLPKTAAWKLLDCDGDGNKNETDPEPLNFCVGGLNNVIPAVGTPQYEFFKEADCDSDGISNSMECFGAITTCQDFDGDGIPNFLDQDSDADGISDRMEQNRDSDGDKDANYLDLDSDNDGILDSRETSNDQDKDGTPNYLDLDSDGDNILDAWEALALYRPHSDENLDGRVDRKGIFTDDNNNGLADILESVLGGTPTEVPDTDRDGLADFLDLDSDNDCLPDSIELTKDVDGDNIPNYRDTDSDNDCIPDLIEVVDCSRPIDSDGDNIPDYLDTDSDNDCINDSKEIGPDCNNPVDTDGDGIPDFKDTDSDNDCIKDSKEVGADCNNPIDTDGDGIPDYQDTDSDNDCIKDAKEVGADCNNPVDTDGDGIPDYKDTDSDNDCIKDAIEVGKDCTKPLDSDGDGIPDYLDSDSDNDCIKDAIEVGKDCNNPADTDGDGIPDYRDTDSDNDCIKDAKEVGSDCSKPVDTDGDGIPDFQDTDSDNDCIKDSIEVGKDCNNPVDSDGDAIPDYQDTDSDNDCIKDVIEVGKNCAQPLDSDGDGIPDYLDSDSDNDCIKDSIEVGKDCNDPVDTDGDGIPDYLDTDSDNDCIKDAKEVGSDCSKPVDTDGDGLPDFQDTDSDNDCIKDSIEVGKDCNNPVDTDGDGIPDYRDMDADNDCIKDSIEVGKDCNKPLDSDGDGIPDYLDLDSDNDCIKDSYEVGLDCNNPLDTDGDGVADFRDTDSDNDCINDALEVGVNCAKPVDTDGDGLPDFRDTDSDNDCISDHIEVGPDCNIPLDTDKDGIPNYQDADSDNDCISDMIEADGSCLNPVDTDKDGLPDYLDSDSDADCIPDSVEVGPKCNKPLDTDGDGIYNFRDTDSDNDCIPDAKEAGKDCAKPVDTDLDGTQDYLDLDSDNDTYSDNIEAGADCKNPVDTDKDGQPDFQDVDSDGDGIPDKLEDDIDYGNLIDCDKDGIPNRLDPDQCNIFLPKGISPNGDGKNDRLIIPGILSNHKNKLTILNRWGNVVFEAENYQNNWTGQTNKAFDLLSTDGLLPDGTYYYVIDFMGARPNIGAYVYINRLEK